MPMRVTSTLIWGCMLATLVGVICAKDQPSSDFQSVKPSDEDVVAAAQFGAETLNKQIINELGDRVWMVSLKPYNPHPWIALWSIQKALLQEVDGGRRYSIEGTIVNGLLIDKATESVYNSIGQEHFITMYNEWRKRVSYVPPKKDDAVKSRFLMAFLMGMDPAKYQGDALPGEEEETYHFVVFRKADGTYELEKAEKLQDSTPSEAETQELFSQSAQIHT